MRTVKGMTIQERIVSDVAIVRISGRVTLTEGTPEVDDVLQRLVQQGHVRIVLDLEEVPYIDSTALGSLLRTHATVSRRGGAMKLLKVKGHVRELLELTRLLTVFEAFDSEAEAIASATSTPPRPV
jgi:anti-sigma B factor antagonist